MSLNLYNNVFSVTSTMSPIWSLHRDKCTAESSEPRTSLVIQVLLCLILTPWGPRRLTWLYLKAVNEYESTHLLPARIVATSIWKVFKVAHLIQLSHIKVTDFRGKEARNFKEEGKLFRSEGEWQMKAIRELQLLGQLGMGSDDQTVYQ